MNNIFVTASYFGLGLLALVAVTALIQEAAYKRRARRAVLAGAALVTILSACNPTPPTPPSMVAWARTLPNTVLAYPDGLAAVGSGAGHVIVVNTPCGVLLATHAEDDVCVRWFNGHDFVITPLSSYVHGSQGGYRLVDA